MPIKKHISLEKSGLTVAGNYHMVSCEALKVSAGLGKFLYPSRDIVIKSIPEP
jgi:hypothetical protein